MDDGLRLVERVRERDTRAFDTLYTRYHRLVFGIGLRMLGDASAAEDVTQAVFLKLWTAPDAFRGGNFGAWLARVTRNRSLDVLRSRTAHAQSDFAADIALDESLDDFVFSKLDSQSVRNAVGALPDDQRVPIEMGFFDGVTHEEIARRLATPLGTVKTRIRSGLRRLRAALDERVTR